LTIAEAETANPRTLYVNAAITITERIETRIAMEA